MSKKRTKEKQIINQIKKQINYLKVVELLSSFEKVKTLSEVKVILDIPFKKAMRFWAQYLKSIRMFESFEFYQDYQYDIPILLTITTFMKRNNISVSNLKAEIEKLKQMKNNYSLNQNTNYQQLLPLGLPKHYYEDY